MSDPDFYNASAISVLPVPEMEPKIANEPRPAGKDRMVEFLTLMRDDEGTLRTWLGQSENDRLRLVRPHLQLKPRQENEDREEFRMRAARRFAFLLYVLHRECDPDPEGRSSKKVSDLVYEALWRGRS